MILPIPNAIALKIDSSAFMENIYPILIFGGIALVFVAVLITSIVQRIKRNRILKFGKKKLARYIQTFNGNVVTRTSNGRVVSVRQYYGIEFEFRTDKGVLLRKKSTGNYTLSDTQAFQSAGLFEVFVLEDDAVIPCVPNTHHIQKYQQIKQTKTCMYCGSSCLQKASKCDSCGASQFEDLV